LSSGRIQALFTANFKPLWECRLCPNLDPDAYLVFSRETKGLRSEILQGIEDRCFRLPMRSPHIQSLNLANAATWVAYQAIRAYLR
jgi:tRNA (cytidine/uridine-2'-O-)-methyltransferase